MNMSAQDFDTTFQEEWHNQPPLFQTEYDGMEAPDGFSEPMADLDFTSPQP